MHDDPSEADQRTAARGRQDHVGVCPAAIQGEQIHDPGGILVILLAEHIAIDAENADVPGPQGIPVHIDNRAVRNKRNHGVAADADGKLRRLRHLIRNGDVVKVLAEYRGSVACGRRGAVKGNDPRLPLLRLSGLQLVPVSALFF